MNDAPTSQGLCESSTFLNIREDGFLYIDKTKYIYDLIKKYAHVFCARPRRFGKTLTLSTIEAIFAGDRKPFKGLDIEPYLTEARFQPRPIISLNMIRATCKKGLMIFESRLVNLV